MPTTTRIHCDNSPADFIELDTELSQNTGIRLDPGVVCISITENSEIACVVLGPEKVAELVAQLLAAIK